MPWSIRPHLVNALHKPLVPEASQNKGIEILSQFANASSGQQIPLEIPTQCSPTSAVSFLSLGLILS